MCRWRELCYCIITFVDHKDPSSGIDDLEHHSCHASAATAKLMVLNSSGIIGQVLSCISLMHDTGSNSWLATVELFRFARFLWRLSAPDWITDSSSEKKINHIINPVQNGTELYAPLTSENREGVSFDLPTSDYYVFDWHTRTHTHTF